MGDLTRNSPGTRDNTELPCQERRADLLRREGHVPTTCPDSPCSSSEELEDQVGSVFSVLSVASKGPQAWKTPVLGGSVNKSALSFSRERHCLTILIRKYVLSLTCGENVSLSSQMFST